MTLKLTALILSLIAAFIIVRVGIFYVDDYLACVDAGNQLGVITTYYGPLSGCSATIVGTEVRVN